jgi:hypothetical protein
MMCCGRDVWGCLSLSFVYTELHGRRGLPFGRNIPRVLDANYVASRGVGCYVVIIE